MISYDAGELRYDQSAAPSCCDRLGWMRYDQSASPSCCRHMWQLRNEKMSAEK